MFTTAANKQTSVTWLTWTLNLSGAWKGLSANHPSLIIYKELLSRVKYAEATLRQVALSISGLTWR